MIEYRGRQGGILKNLYALGFAILFILVCVLDLSSNAEGIHTPELWRILHLENLASWHVFWQIRLPKMLMAVIAGMGLGVGGLIAQNVLGNPLATPYTLGISNAATFGATAAILLIGRLPVSGHLEIHLVMLSALFFSFLALVFILLLSWYKVLSPVSMILAGMGTGALFHALTMFALYFSTDSQLSMSVIWSFGDIAKASWEDIFILSSVLVPVYSFFQLNSRNYNVMLFGDNEGKNLGINPKIFRMLSLFLSSMLAALITAITGVIGFIGLASPHLARMLFRADHRVLIPYSAILGATLLLLAHIGSKILLGITDVPVGVLTPFIGVPILIYLLAQRTSRNG